MTEKSRKFNKWAILLYHYIHIFQPIVHNMWNKVRNAWYIMSSESLLTLLLWKCYLLTFPKYVSLVSFMYCYNRHLCVNIIFKLQSASLQLRSCPLFASDYQWVDNSQFSLPIWSLRKVMQYFRPDIRLVFIKITQVICLSSWF